jgi:hypothetical protein
VSRKRYKPKQIISMPREVDVPLPGGAERVAGSEMALPFQFLYIVVAGSWSGLVTSAINPTS